MWTAQILNVFITELSSYHRPFALSYTAVSLSASFLKLSRETSAAECETMREAHVQERH